MTTWASRREPKRQDDLGAPPHGAFGRRQKLLHMVERKLAAPGGDSSGRRVRDLPFKT
jgi:hypothetical protein